MTWLYSWIAGKAGWLLVIIALGFLLMLQQVRVSNATARTARTEQALANYKASVAETARIAQSAADRKKTEQLEQQKEAANAARTRETKLRADADGARTELDRLRRAISEATRRDPVPGADAAPSDQPATTEGVVLLECAEAFTELAGKADGHASDARTLIESWPK